jgi:hypothetical protein
MGTNYYLRVDPCTKCGHSPNELHIGKSSGGWCFSLHVDARKGINSLDDWKPLFKTGTIFNEYGDQITGQEMWSVITERGSDGPHDWAGFDFERNHAEKGPRGLARHKLGPYCVGHGEGTWDLIPGEFS